jgi:hypothetical protein
MVTWGSPILRNPQILNHQFWWACTFDPTHLDFLTCKWC